MERLVLVAKRIAALLLLASLFLPLARCSYNITTPAPDGGPDIVVPQHRDTIPWREVDGTGSGLLILVAFTWPLLMQVAALFAPGRFRTRVAFVIEFLLCLLSAGCIFQLLFFSTRVRHGFWIAAGGLLLYATCLGWQFWQATFSAARRRTPDAGAGPDDGGQT